MIRAFYSASAGTASYQSHLNVTANNISNASTTGFKSQNTVFSDLIYTKMPTAEQQNAQVGNGVRVGDVSSSLEKGNLEQTGRTLDAAIAGEGYFAVRSADGATYYTRNGNFQIANTAGNRYLVTSDGDFVLNDALQQIVITGEAQDVKYSAPSFTANNAGTTRLAVVTFENPYALQRAGDSKFIANVLSGEGQLAYDADVRQSALETSNVDMGKEMSKMMEAQRGFQFSAQIIKTADELENTANHLRD